MKTLAATVLFLSLTYCSLFAQDSDDAEAKLHIYRYLDDHKPRAIFNLPDSDNALNSIKYYYNFDSLIDAKHNIRLYFFSWTCEQGCVDYLMAIDFAQHTSLSMDNIRRGRTSMI